jgi:hypothetical protein
VDLVDRGGVGDLGLVLPMDPGLTMRENPVYMYCTLI